MSKKARTYKKMREKTTHKKEKADKIINILLFHVKHLKKRIFSAVDNNYSRKSLICIT